MSPSKSGFALTEVLVALFVLGVSTVAVTGLAVLSTRTSFNAERQTVALAIANEKVEHVRSLPYEDVGYKDATGNEADGILDRRHDVQRNQQKYTVDTRIELVDDPANGILPEISLNEETADYKRVTIKVGWDAIGGSNNQNVSVVSLVSKESGTDKCTPGDPDGCPGTGSPGEGACVPKEPCPDSGVCPAPKAKPYCPPGAQYCQQCYTDSDCEAGQACNTDTRVCEPKQGACKTSADCSGGQVCSSGQCSASCVSAGCDGGEICNTDTGVCTISCNDSTCDCPPGLECNKDKGFCEEKKPECSDGVDNKDEEDTLADAADAGCHEDEDLQKPFVPDDDNEIDGGGPCSSDDQCPSGMSCSNGTCQGGWCEDPLGPIVDCSQLPPMDPDPTCRSINSCRLQGRFAITGYIPRTSDDYDPSCNVGVVVWCEAIHKWLPCPPCPDYPAQCEDGLNNDYPEDTDVDFPADRGCISRKDHSEADILPECSDRKDNDDDGTIDWNGRQTLIKFYPKDPDCFGPDDPTERPMPECSDGGDNKDPDTVADDKDPACYIGNSVQPGNYRADLPTENDPECSDTINNDFPEDTLVDAADPGCHVNNDVKNGAYLPGVDESDVVKPQCSDGKNNDSPEDLLTDAADPGCHLNDDLSKPYDKNDNLETNPSMQCADGYDNNGGITGSDALGRIDKADPGCHVGYDVQNGQYIQTNNEGSTECTDGRNNDAPEDYLVDADDPGCHVGDIKTNAYVPADNFESQFPLNSCQQLAAGATAQFVKQPDGSYRCPAGAICNITTSVAGNPFTVACEGGSSGILIDRACSLYGFMGKPGKEDDESGIRACRENIILQFDKNRNRIDDNGENWPAATVQCAPNENACIRNLSCSASFSQARCGGPRNDLPQPVCSPFTGSIAISCQGCVGKAGRDGICATCAGENGSNDTTCKSQPGERCMQDSNCSGGLKCTLDRGSEADKSTGTYRCQIPCSADDQCPAGKTCSVHDFNPFGQGACLPKT